MLPDVRDSVFLMEYHDLEGVSELPAESNSVQHSCCLHLLLISLAINVKSLQVFERVVEGELVRALNYLTKFLLHVGWNG